MQPTSNENTEQPEVTNNTNISPNEPNDKTTRRLKFPKFLSGKKAKVTVLILAIVLVAGVVSVYWYSSNNKNTQDNKDPVVFSIDDRQFRASEVNPYLEQAQKYSIDRAKAQEGLVEAMKYKIAAEKLNVQITDAQKREALQITSFAKIAKLTKELDKWSEMIGFKIAMEKKITLSKSTANQGYSFVFYFGNLIVPANPEDTLPNFGNQELAEKDRQYAKQKAEEYRDMLSNNKTTPDEVLSKVSADSKLNYHYFPTTTYSVKFGHSNDPDKTWQKEVFFQDIVKNIEQSKEFNKPSEVKTGKLPINNNPKKDQDYKDCFYYFIYPTTNSDKTRQAELLINSMKVRK